MYVEDLAQFGSFFEKNNVESTLLLCFCSQTIIFRGCLQLNLMKGGSVTKRGEYCMLFLEMPFFSAYNPELEKLKVEPTVESAQNVSRSFLITAIALDTFLIFDSVKQDV